MNLQKLRYLNEIARRGNWLRQLDYAFIELFAPQLTRKMVETTIKGGSDDPGL